MYQIIVNAVLKALDYWKQSPFVLNAYRLVAVANAIICSRIRDLDD